MLKVGETAYCSVSVKDVNGDLTSPSTSMTITIKGPTKTILVNATAMTNTGGATGKYHYGYTIADGPGTYYVTYIATSGTDIGIAEDTFGVEAVA